MDLIGSFEKSASGYHHILEIVDHVTQYPETILLHEPTIATELMKVFGKIRISREILLDSGSETDAGVM